MHLLKCKHFSTASSATCSDNDRSLNTLQRVWLPVCDDEIIITQVLRQLHWLPVKQRVVSKLAVCVQSTAVHGFCIVLFVGELPTQNQNPAAIVNSQSQHTLDRPDKPCLDDRSIAAAGPRFWNSLPVHLRQPRVISTGTSDASVRGCMTAAPSDYCFFQRRI